MGEALRVLTRIGAETAVFHADADADLDRFLFRSSTTRDDYRTFLVRVYGFIAPLETALTSAGGIDGLIDLAPRAKTSLIVNDLLALGMTVDEIAHLPQCLTIPLFKGPPAALGWMYVAERPMLASPVIRRHLQTRLPAESRTASRYLSCYAGLVGTYWRELGEAMDQVATTSVLGDRIVAAACEAFRMLNRWRQHDLQLATGVARDGIHVA